LDISKSDRFLEERIKGEKDEDIKKWKLDDVIESVMNEQPPIQKYSRLFY
jgi:hypothetical protein